MGHGWNLGNSFDGADTDESKEDKGETAWGNPVVTRELIRAVKAKGSDSIRIPMTMFRRYTEEDGKCVADEAWLARYKEVVDWAVEEGLYVMVNIHHDSWIWLKEWDGDTASREYVRYVQLWEQLADYLKDEPEQVCFETINEPDFTGDDEEKQEKLDVVNLAAYHAIRESGGQNASRMIVMPTLSSELQQQLLKRLMAAEDMGELLACYGQALTSLSQKIGTAGGGNTIRRVYYYMEKNYDKDLKLESIAKTFNYNSAYLGKLFRKEMGGDF